MWLLPLFSALSSLAVRTFYRLRVAGERVPESGPVLLVANHPNSLVDPAMVVALAGRPTRFLAKAPLFDDPRVGWLVRGAGAIPVHRRQDDATRMGSNDDTFRAAHDALAAGDAVGIFPEGISHSEPSLAPLKTGAARIALGAAARSGGAIPVVPVGLSLREKHRFRSEALALVGAPVPWDDLAPLGDRADAVRELTARIDAALREVTLDLESWEDAPMVEFVESVYAAEHASDPDPARRLARLREVSGALARLRADERTDWLPLRRAAERHMRRLARAGMRPDQLRAPRGAEVLRWSLRNALLAATAPIALVGAAVFFVPYRATGLLERRAAPATDIRATYKLLVGGALHLAWWLLVSALALVFGGLTAGLVALVGLPPAGLYTVWLLDRGRRVEGEAFRFLLRARRRDLLEQLRAEQRRLAGRLEALRLRMRAPAPER